MSSKYRADMRRAFRHTLTPTDIKLTRETQGEFISHPAVRRYVSKHGTDVPLDNVGGLGNANIMGHLPTASELGTNLYPEHRRKMDRRLDYMERHEELKNPMRKDKAFEKMKSMCIGFSNISGGPLPLSERSGTYFFKIGSDKEHYQVEEIYGETFAGALNKALQVAHRMSTAVPNMGWDNVSYMGENLNSFSTIRQQIGDRKVNPVPSMFTPRSNPLISSITGASVDTVAFNVSRALRDKGFFAEVYVKGPKSVNISNVRLDTARHGKNVYYTDRGSRRGNILGWYDWVAFNNTVNDVLDLLGVTAKVTSLNGQFVVRDASGRKFSRDWAHLKYRNVGSMMFPVEAAIQWSPENDDPSDRWKDSDLRNPAAICPTCGGPGMFMGKLGKLDWFRCQNCGMTFSEHQGYSDYTTPVQDNPSPKPSSGTRLQCMECGKVFTRKLGAKTFEVKCPKCGGYDVDLARR